MKYAAEKWLAAYLVQVLNRGIGHHRPPELLCVAITDHFEPYWGKADQSTALARLAAWEQKWPRLCEQVSDGRGNPPQRDFFYPIEEYDPLVLDRLARLCEKGVGAVEVHLHHDNDSSAELEDRLSAYAETLHRKHGLLRLDPQGGKPVYGFIHGNWALDNSRPDGRWCGVNDELSILKRTGCYADFTLPSAPSPCQTSTVNSIYYATDDPERPKSHDKGTASKVGQAPSGDLLMVQGVLAFNWRLRKHTIFPGFENSDLADHMPPRVQRVPVWLKYAPAVQGAEQVRFLKLHSHGAPERHHEALLGNSMLELLQFMTTQLPARWNCEVRFVTCWEMVQMIHALERGEEFI